MVIVKGWVSAVVRLDGPSDVFMFESGNLGPPVARFAGTLVKPSVALS